MLWICNVCTSAYSVGASRCPECGADDHVDEGAVDVVGAVPVDSEGSGADAPGGSRKATGSLSE